jgi:hypothetical protein
MLGDGMKTKQLALDALKHALLQESPKDIDWDRLESAIAALEADIAQPVAYCVSYDGKTPYSNLSDDLEYVRNACRVVGGSAVVMPLYTIPPEPAVNAELLEAAKWCVALCEETGMTETNAYASAKSAIAKATS